MASTKKQRGTGSGHGPEIAPRSSFRATKKKAAPKKQPVAPKKQAAPKKQPVAKKAAPKPKTIEVTKAIALGEITAPSGTLDIFDVGLLGFMPREALEPAMIKCAVPSDRALPVVGVRVGTGRFADCWDHVAIVVGDGEVTHAKKLGKAGVDCARLILIDHAALDHWQHEDSLDGKADFVFWGKDEQILAQITGAKRLPEGYGWINIDVAEAESKYDLADRKKAENGWKLAIDLRPHTHHFHALAAARATKHGAGTLELAGSRLMLLFTSWGDGVFPVYMDLDADEHPVRVRIQLATVESAAAMSAVKR